MSKIQSDLEAKLAVESNKLHKMKDQVNYFLKELQKNQYALDDRVKILESQQIHQDPVQTIASLQEILSANVTKGKKVKIKLINKICYNNKKFFSSKRTASAKYANAEQHQKSHETC